MTTTLERVRQQVASHPVALKMDYPTRMEAKLAWLREVFPSAPEGLVAAVLANPSVKLSHLESMLGFVARVEPNQRPSLGRVAALLWPELEEAELSAGLSEDRAARLAFNARLGRRADLLRRFARTVPVGSWEPRGLLRLTRTLKISPEQALELVILSPRLLRGLVKSPRPLQACLGPLLVSLGWACLLTNPLTLWLAITLTTGLGTWWLCTRCASGAGCAHLRTRPSTTGRGPSGNLETLGGGGAHAQPGCRRRAIPASLPL